MEEMENDKRVSDIPRVDVIASKQHPTTPPNKNIPAIRNTKPLEIFFKNLHIVASNQNRRIQVQTSEILFKT